MIWSLGGGRGLRAKQFIVFPVSVKHKKDKKIFLHKDLTYSFTKAIKCIFIHCLLYNQAFSFNRKRLEQIFTFSTEHLFNFSVMVHTTELNYNYITASQICTYSTYNVIINAVILQWGSTYRLFSALSSCTMIKVSERKAKESICMLWKLSGRQNIFIKIFMFLKGGKGRNKMQYDVLL